MISTGERYLPEIDGAYIAYEHWHRYLFASRFVTGKSVLDVASGEGYGSALLARSAADVVGVDLDPEAVAHAQRKYPRDNLTFQCGSADALPLPGQHLFDVIVSFETLEHIPADAQRRFAAEIKRLLKPDGRLLISTPNRLIYTEKNQHHNPFHLQEFSPDEFTSFLGNYFTDIRILCQRVYPGSYIWDEVAATAPCAEYQLELAGGEMQPVFADHKEKLYLIALCSDQPSPPPGNSLLLDLSEVATRGASGKAYGYKSTLFIDGGAGFRAEVCRTQELPPGPGPFHVTFTLDDFGSVRALRWDPLESRTCRVRLDAVEWEDGAGQVHRLDPAAATSNGERMGEGLLAFDTFDPMVFLPVSGSMVRLTLEGWYEADDLGTSLARVDAACEALRRRDEQGGGVTAARLTSTLFVDTGGDFRAEESFTQEMPPAPGRFRQSFGLAGVGRVRALRWDPLESWTCRLRLDAVEWEDDQGRVHRLELGAVTGNGERGDDDCFTFDTIDPMVFLPISGAVVRVTIDGWFEVDDRNTSLARLDAAARNSRILLQERDEQVRQCGEQLRVCQEEMRALTEMLASARRLTRSLLGQAESADTLGEPALLPLAHR